MIVAHDEQYDRSTKRHRFVEFEFSDRKPIRISFCVERRLPILEADHTDVGCGIAHHGQGGIDHVGLRLGAGMFHDPRHVAKLADRLNRPPPMLL